MWEINIVLSVFKEFGLAIGLGSIIIFLLWKIMTNHLAHIALDVKEVVNGVNNIQSEVKDMRKDMSLDRERIAKLEGKLE